MQDALGPSPPRVLVIGLDGATWRIALPLMAGGRLPNLSRLVSQGTTAVLQSTVPPISAAAWVTFLTGQNPGRHGVYQFRKLDLRRYGGYRDEFTSSHDYAGRSLLDLVGSQGLRVGAVGVPMTYPPFPVNGFMISGFPRPFGPQAHTYPPDHAAMLGCWDEMPDNFNFSLSPAKTVESSDYWVRRYTDIALSALAREHYDLFLIVWNSTDTIPHLYWKYSDPSFPAYDPEGAKAFGQVINRQYEEADVQIGRLLTALSAKELERETTVVVMSDHGMGPFPHRQVHLNAWLRACGLLVRRSKESARPSLVNRAISGARNQLPTQWRHRLRRVLPAGARASLFARHMNLEDVDWSRTQAYRLKIFPTVEGIVVNVKGRQAQGIVEPGAAYEALRTQLLADLAELRDPETNAPIVARAHRREALFEGPYLDEIPDVVVELAEDYTGGTRTSGPLVTSVPLQALSDYSATHRPQGLLVMTGPGIKAGAQLPEAHIVDLAPTLMHIMGLSVSSAMDGRVLTGVFKPQAARAVVFADYDGPGDLAGLATELSAADEAAIREQLTGLGYL